MSRELQTVVRRMRLSADLADGGEGVSDAVLLQRFIEHRDEAAFELLVWRHGVLVLATCRRILGPGADVEDAFQATFLALVRHASRLRRWESLPAWLHRVASRIAGRVRRSRVDRIHRERRAAVSEVQPSTASDHSDLGPILDAEIDRLPERFRVPFVLFHLQGMTHDEAARHLGVPKGTLLSRLARAREKLRFRLVRRGVTLGAGATVVFAATPGGLTAGLVGATLKMTFSGREAVTAPAVAALTEGVLRNMYLTKIKTVAGVILVAATFATGGTLWACHGRFRPRPAPVVPLLTVAAESPVAEPQPPVDQPAPKPPQVDRLTEVLAQFEKRCGRTASYWCQLTRHERDQSGSAREYKGEFRYLRPNYLALQMIREDNPNLYEMYVRNEDKHYQYRPQTKEIWVLTSLEDMPLGFFAIPLLGKQLSVYNLLLSLPFGIKLAEGLERFDLKLSKVTPHYIYIEILPRTRADQTSFSRAQLVLTADNYLPRRLWMTFPGGNEVTWDVTAIDITTKLIPADFVAPMPKDWKVREVNLPKANPEESSRPMPGVPKKD